LIELAKRITGIQRRKQTQGEFILLNTCQAISLGQASAEDQGLKGDGKKRAEERTSLVGVKPIVVREKKKKKLLVRKLARHANIWNAEKGAAKMFY
jgi:hypothetical protein